MAATDGRHALRVASAVGGLRGQLQRSDAGRPRSSGRLQLALQPLGARTCIVEPFTCMHGVSCPVTCEGRRHVAR